MKAADVPSFYDAILQRLIRAQDGSMMLPPFLDPHIAAAKVFARWFKKGGYAEELSRVLGRNQPNLLRSCFSGVAPILDELEQLSPSELSALSICHEANRRRMERRFRVSGIIVVLSAVLTVIEKFGSPLLSFMPNVGLLQQIMPYILGGGGVFIALLWVMSLSIIGRLEVFSDLLEIVVQKPANQPPEPTAASGRGSS